MKIFWDYNKEDVEKSQNGRIKKIERMINYGCGGEKIKLAEVKKWWKEINITTNARRLFELLIWGKYQSSQNNKRRLFVK